MDSISSLETRCGQRDGTVERPVDKPRLVHGVPGRWDSRSHSSPLLHEVPRGYPEANVEISPFTFSDSSESVVISRPTFSHAYITVV